MSQQLFEPKDLDDALRAGDVEWAKQAFGSLSGWAIHDAAIDVDEEILYVAAEREGKIMGFCCFITHPMQLQVIPETDGPFYLGAPAHLIEKLDHTFSETAIRWRRDCLALHYREMALRSRILHPSWTAFYSEEPLGQLRYPAHVAIIVGGAPQGVQEIAITDGVSWRPGTLPVSEIGRLLPVWKLEWSLDPMVLTAIRGRGGIHYIGVGPAEYRVGMLFNELGGLLAWSGAASHAAQMADMANAEDSGFSRVMLLNQLNHWQGRSATVGDRAG